MSVKGGYKVVDFSFLDLTGTNGSIDPVMFPWGVIMEKQSNGGYKGINIDKPFVFTGVKIDGVTQPAITPLWVRYKNPMGAYTPELPAGGRFEVAFVYRNANGTKNAIAIVEFITATMDTNDSMLTTVCTIKYLDLNPAS